MRARVAGRRERQAERFRVNADVFANAQVDAGLLRRVVRPTPPVARILQRSVDRHGLSARAYQRVLKVAGTIADLAGAEEIGEEDALEELSFRVGDRRR